MGNCFSKAVVVLGARFEEATQLALPLQRDTVEGRACLVNSRQALPVFNAFGMQKQKVQVEAVTLTWLRSVQPPNHPFLC